MRNRKYLVLSLCLLLAFVLWTAAVASVDVQPIGPDGSAVGFAALNRFVHQLTGVHMGWYILTDQLSLIPLGFVAGFAILGLSQWIRRKQLSRVDRSILLLGVFYVVTGAVYLFFERCIINYRPVLIDGILEASYPSSTTVLMLCVLSTAAMELRRSIQTPSLRKWVIAAMAVFAVTMVAGRLISGVHWFTDILGSILLSAGLVTLYFGLL